MLRKIHSCPVLIIILGLFFLSACSSEDTTIQQQTNSLSKETTTEQNFYVDPDQNSTHEDEAASTEPASSDPNSTVQEITPNVHIIEIVDFAFSPSKLEVNVGDIVKFINRDEVEHTATSDDKSFDTGLLKQNKEAEVTFSQKGDFRYYCKPHPGMKGTIIVVTKE